MPGTTITAMKDWVELSERVEIPKQSTRKRTPEGFMEADAVLLRGGLIPFMSKELGMDGPNRQVYVYRGPETVSHPETIASIARSPITLGHGEGMLGLEDSRNRTEGNVLGWPVFNETENQLDGRIVLRTADSIMSLESGLTEELSVGYRTRMRAVENMPYVARFDGPLYNNHIGMVERGRQGPTVRVKEAPEEDTTVGVFTDEDKGFITGAFNNFRESIAELVKPKSNVPEGESAVPKNVMERLEALENEKKEREEADEKAKRDKELDEKIEEKLTEQRTAMESKQGALVKCLPLLTTEQMPKATATEATANSIYALVLGDSMDAAKKDDTSYLEGAVDEKLKQLEQRKAHQPWANTSQATFRSTPTEDDPYGLAGSIEKDREAKQNRLAGTKA